MPSPPQVLWERQFPLLTKDCDSLALEVRRDAGRETGLGARPRGRSKRRWLRSGHLQARHHSSPCCGEGRAAPSLATPEAQGLCFAGQPSGRVRSPARAGPDGATPRCVCTLPWGAPSPWILQGQREAGVLLFLCVDSAQAQAAWRPAHHACRAGLGHGGSCPML